MTRSNTADNSRNATGKPFVKGDPRINRKGRPKSFDALRSLAQSISHEAAKSGGREIVMDGHVVTVAEMILRGWAASKDPRLQMAFMETAFGKPPTKTEVTGADGGPIEVSANVESIMRKLLPELADGGTTGTPEPPQEE